MGNTLQGNTVLLFGGQKDIAPHPVVMLGIDPATGQAVPLSQSSGGTSVVPPSVTVNSEGKTASQSGSIPLGAKGWTFTITGGTATFNGVAGLSAGFSDSDVNTLAAAINYSFDNPGTGYVRYNT